MLNSESLMYTLCFTLGHTAHIQFSHPTIGLVQLKSSVILQQDHRKYRHTTVKTNYQHSLTCIGPLQQDKPSRELARLKDCLLWKRLESER